MAYSTVFKADISRFHSSTPLAYEGESLKQVNDLRKSIQSFGLFTPILVERVGATLTVIDGRKRLAALMGLVTAGVMPRELVKVPYIVTVKTATRRQKSDCDYLPLLSNRQKYHLLINLIESGKTAAQIAETLYAPVSYVRKLGSVARLSRKLKQAVLASTLTFSQGQAFSTLPNHTSQERLLELLGPFVDAPTIMAAIEAGEPVVSCGDNNVIIMPSRQRSRLRRLAAA